MPKRKKESLDEEDTSWKQFRDDTSSELISNTGDDINSTVTKLLDDTINQASQSNSKYDSTTNSILCLDHNYNSNCAFVSNDSLEDGEISHSLEEESDYVYTEDSLGNEVDVVGFPEELKDGYPSAISESNCINVPYNDSNSCSSNSSQAPTTTSSISDISESCEEDKPLIKSLLKNSTNSRTMKSVKFTGVTVYYFPRSQGFTCVPSQGGSTLGMDSRHCYIRSFSLEGHAEEKKRVHRDILLRQRKFAKLYQRQDTNSESEDDSHEDISDISDSELEMDSCYFLQPVPIKQRRALLRASGVRKIETLEKEDCKDIRQSREYCGCECRIYCDPETCQCSLAGIKCQVDRLFFPCGCTRDGCGNLNGRVEFNPVRVRTHFIHTIMRLQLERKNEQQRLEEMMGQSSSDSSDSCSNLVNSNQVHYFNEQSNNNYNRTIINQRNNNFEFGIKHSVPSSNSGQSLNCQDEGYNFSPDNSSYSENSDCTSEEYDPEDVHKKEKHIHYEVNNEMGFNGGMENFVDSNMYENGYISRSNGSGYGQSFGYQEMYSNSYISPVGSDDQCHSYTDLSQSIASSKSVECISGLLSCNSVKNLNIITPVSMVPGSTMNIDKENENGSKDVQSISKQSSEELSENFGEIIKKTMVETVTA